MIFSYKIGSTITTVDQLQEVLKKQAAFISDVLISGDEGAEEDVIFCVKDSNHEPVLKAKSIDEATDIASKLKFFFGGFSKTFEMDTKLQNVFTTSYGVVFKFEKVGNYTGEPPFYLILCKNNKPEPGLVFSDFTTNSDKVNMVLNGHVLTETKRNKFRLANPSYANGSNSIELTLIQNTIGHTCLLVPLLFYSTMSDEKPLYSEHCFFLANNPFNAKNGSYLSSFDPYIMTIGNTKYLTNGYWALEDE